jgi:methylated-DNA-[protein]-cysteine S-methyltransferase
MRRILARLASTVKAVMRAVVVSEYPAPFGPLAIAARGDVLVAIRLEGHPERLAREWSRHEPAERGRLTRVLTRAFDAYFGVDIAAIDALEAEPAGTEFQQTVWAELRRIRAGTTMSYSQLAARIGRPDAVRAVGTANGANPVPIVIPCHRVIGANGSLVGYGGGLEMKRWLLAHEGLIPGRLW